MIKLEWLLFLALAALPAAAQKAHQHGKATLDVAIEGKSLTLEFESPLHDLVGFERQPANDKERAALGALDAYLESGQAFVPTAAAGCKLAEAKARSAEAGKDHAESRATLRFDCSDMAALKQVEAAIFKQYARLKRIDVRLVTSKGQSASRLTPAKRNLAL